MNILRWGCGSCRGWKGDPQCLTKRRCLADEKSRLKAPDQIRPVSLMHCLVLANTRALSDSPRYCQWTGTTKRLRTLLGNFPALQTTTLSTTSTLALRTHSLGSSCLMWNRHTSSKLVESICNRVLVLSRFRISRSLPSSRQNGRGSWTCC